MILEIKIKLFLNFLINSEDTCRVMKFSGMLNLSIAIYRLQLKHVGCHFRLSPEVKKEIEIFKDNLSNQTVYHIIMSVLCLKVLTLLKVEVSTSGYFKNKF